MEIETKLVEANEQLEKLQNELRETKEKQRQTEKELKETKKKNESLLGELDQANGQTKKLEDLVENHKKKQRTSSANALVRMIVKREDNWLKNAFSTVQKNSWNLKTSNFQFKYELSKVKYD